MKKPTSHTPQPLVSVITPLYNAARFIQACSASIKAQTYQNWEHIIVDDASTDGSLSLAQELASTDSRIRVVTLSRNKGAAYARNKATELASGDYIAFLDADDLWYSNHLLELKKQILKFPEAGLYCNNYEVFYTKNLCLGVIKLYI